MNTKASDLEGLKNEFFTWMVNPDYGSPYSKMTVRTYQMAINHFYDFVKLNQIESLAEVNSAWIRSFLRSLSEKRLSPSSIATYLSSIDRFFSFLSLDDIVESNPVKEIKAQFKEKNIRLGRKPHRIPAVLLHNEREALIDVIFSRNHQNTNRDLAMIGFMLDSGVRTDEMSRITIGQAKNYLINGQLRVIGKGNKERIIRPLTNYRAFLQSYVDELSNVGTGDLLFVTNKQTPISQQNLHKIVDRYLTLTDIKKPQMGGHLLRHTAASLMLASGINIRTVQEYMGHSSITTTENYVHLLE